MIFDSVVDSTEEYRDMFEQEINQEEGHELVFYDSRKMQPGEFWESYESFEEFDQVTLVPGYGESGNFFDQVRGDIDLEDVLYAEGEWENKDGSNRCEIIFAIMKYDTGYREEEIAAELIDIENGFNELNVRFPSE